MKIKKGMTFMLGDKSYLGIVLDSDEDIRDSKENSWHIAWFNLNAGIDDRWDYSLTKTLSTKEAVEIVEDGTLVDLDMSKVFQEVMK